MEMPTPCQHCGEWFDLNDGHTSNKWYPNTVICSDCETLEEVEIGRDEEIEDLRRVIDNAEFDIKNAEERLTELGFNE